MAITISGENNNDRILASDGVIDQISGINIVGLITASHINVGSNIQLGNAGIVTATTFVGNVTGNVNSTSPLLLQTGGSERFRITGNNELGIAGANYGSAGQVLTSGGSGSAVSWTTPAVTGFTNGSNNRVVTATSGSGLNAESNLTYDGNTLFASGNITAASDGNRLTQGGVALTVRHLTNAAMRANHFIHDDFPSGSGTYYIQVTESGVTNDRNLALQGYGGKVKIGSGGVEPVETLDVSGNVKATSINLANSIFHTGDTDTLMSFSTDTIKFETAGDERLRILSDGTIRGGSQVAAQPSPTVAGFQFDAGGEYLRISKGGGASGTSGAGMSLIGGGSNTNHLATTSWGSNIYLINTNLTDNNANALVFANKNSLASSMIVGKNDSHASRNGSLIFATSNGSSPTQRMRITKEGSINIGTDSTQSTHMLYMQGTGSVGIHLRADTDNSGENDNPYISMGQDGAATQQLKLGMAGDANADFNMQITNSPFLHANNGTSQPLQLAHMSDMAVTISSVSGLGAGGQSATDPRDFDSDGSLAGNAVGGMKIHHYGNDTAAALMLSGHNNSGTPGTETRTQLTHTGANLRFHIEHHGIEAFNISPTGNIYLKNCSTIPSFTTSYNVSALSLKGGGLMNYQENNIYLLCNTHYDGAWRNTYAGGGGYISLGSGTFRHYYYSDQSSANQSLSLIQNVSFYKNNSAGTSLNYGNRPSAQGQIIIWGHSDQTTAGGIEFHSSGGGGAGYGSKITTQSNGTMQFHCRSNNSAWSTYLTISSQNGQVSGNLNDTSDISLKRNVESISTSCIDNIKKLNPVSFEWKAFDSDEKQIGFIAQEVEKVIPEAVKGEDGEKALNVTGIVAQLTKALQESITKIETLEAKVAALEGS